MLGKLLKTMFCESCHQREATVHLTTMMDAQASSQEPEIKRKQHFCEQCADTYFTCTPGMNPHRQLICLSDSYRSKLYDLLEVTHPEAFDNSDSEACRRSSRLMTDFLCEQLKKEKIEVNEGALTMLCLDFFGSHYFYTRADQFKEKKR